ncbi:MAG: DUF3850 domain-containing protein, partial [Ruminococcus flavefaciens]|nr:DUF3850 domain-containing protein [Ruminococcus flavefaciens]
SAAYGLSGMSGQEQQEAFDRYRESGRLSHKDVMAIKEDHAGQQDTDNLDKHEKEAGIKPPEADGSQLTAGGGYQYINKADAEKTEEQDRIDRETAGKLREMQQEEMKHFPSDMRGSSQKTHQIRIGTAFFDDVFSGKKSFELRKNDRGYEEGDILEMMEFTNGKYTGRSLKALVTYLLEDFAGLKEEYCIMSIKVICYRGIDMAAGSK